jgi:hypothetical protein
MVKTAAWRALPPPAERNTLLTTARQQLIEQLVWPDQIQLLPGTVTDQATDFRLDQMPGRYAKVTGINDGAVLSGQIRLMVGRHLFLDTQDGPLLADMRRFAGWRIHPAGTAAKPAGLSMAVQSPPRERHDHHPSLF